MFKAYEGLLQRMNISYNIYNTRQIHHTIFLKRPHFQRPWPTTTTAGGWTCRMWAAASPNCAKLWWDDIYGESRWKGERNSSWASIIQNGPGMATKWVSAYPSGFHLHSWEFFEILAGQEFWRPQSSLVVQMSTMMGTQWVSESEAYRNESHEAAAVLEKGYNPADLAQEAARAMGLNPNRRPNSRQLLLEMTERGCFQIFFLD